MPSKPENFVYIYETTQIRVFQKPPLLPQVKTEYKARPSCFVRPEASPKSLQCLENWRKEVPFDLFCKKKGIIQENPWEPQAAFDKPIDHEREHVQRTRPCVLMTPACNIDVVEEPARAIIIENMYTTATASMMREPYANTPKDLSVVAPLPPLPAPANPYYLEDDQREEVRKTRPRVYMTPAVSMDDAEDNCRDILIKETYTTSTHHALKTAREMADRGRLDVRAPLPSRPSPPGPQLLKLPPYQFPVVSPEWRMESASWDTTSLRAGIDPTPQFWLAKSPKP